MLPRALADIVPTRPVGDPSQSGDFIGYSLTDWESTIQLHANTVRLQLQRFTSMRLQLELHGFFVPAKGAGTEPLYLLQQREYGRVKKERCGFAFREECLERARTD